MTLYHSTLENCFHQRSWVPSQNTHRPHTLMLSWNPLAKGPLSHILLHKTTHVITPHMYFLALEGPGASVAHHTSVLDEMRLKTHFGRATKEK